MISISYKVHYDLALLQVANFTVCPECFPSVRIYKIGRCTHCNSEKNTPKLYSKDNNVDPVIINFVRCPINQDNNLYNNSITFFGHFRFVLGPIHLGLVPGLSTTEGESYDSGKVAILPTSENTTLTPTTARRSFAWLPNSPERLIVLQTTPLCPCYAFTWPVVSRRG